jgi:hypothetical protein
MVESPIISLDLNGQEGGLNLAQLPHNRNASTTTIVQPTPVAAPHHSNLTGNNQPRMLHLCIFVMAVTLTLLPKY